MSSLQTTLARREAERLDGDWRTHKRNCSRCSLAAQKRRLDETCDAGARIVTGRAAAHRVLDAEKAADQAPNPDQAALFDA